MNRYSRAFAFLGLVLVPCAIWAGFASHESFLPAVGRGSGNRKAFSDWQPIAENRDFVARSTDAGDFTGGLPEESIRRLKTSGILNDDGSIDLETARKRGWDKRKGWNDPMPGAVTPAP